VTSTAARIPFNRPHSTGTEGAYVREAIANGHLSGNGPFSARCTEWLVKRTGAAGALLTHSGTGALEMAMILANVGPGDEVIMPSFTFVSTANCVVVRGGVPVFVDIRPDTLNIDEGLIEAAITPRTKALLPIQYAGVACEMDPIMEIARHRKLLVVEDAAQGIMSARDNRELGAIGDLGALSFHETKNVTSGEGGALLISDPESLERAEIVHEKGTNRQKFFRGQVDKYTWVDAGSSFPMSEIGAAFLWGQLERAESITARRLQIWDIYHAAFAEAEEGGALRRPVIPARVRHNAHMYYLLLPDGVLRDDLIQRLKAVGIAAVFHYVPLHSAPAGRRHGRSHGSLAVTDDLSSRLVRLPLWPDLTDAEVHRVISEVLRIVVSQQGGQTHRPAFVA
jgi:dTDP-4-amino-4,6-dideoxygalactose transaminase